MATDKTTMVAPEQAAAPMAKEAEKETPEKDYGPGETMPAKAMGGAMPQATMMRQSAALQRQMGNARLGRMLQRKEEEETPTEEPMEAPTEEATEETAES